MSDYGVPADAAGLLPWSWAEERLVRNRNYWMITSSAAARPHAMPVWGVWMTVSERFFFSCSPNARKARNIAANPQTTVAVDDTVECISVEGRSRCVDPASEGAAVDAMVEVYVAKYWSDPSAYDEIERFLRSHAIFEFTPERAFAVIEREEEFSARATRWVW
jgi:Pyridoxamine 5'-phosphate oxidase